MHRSLAEVMVNAKDRRLVEGAEQNSVEFLGGGAVVTEGFFHDDARAFSAVRLRQLFHDQTEQRRWDSEVVRRPLRGTQFLANGLKGRRVLVVTVNVVEQAGQLVESGAVESAAVLLDALPRPRAELFEVPTGLGHTDDRHIEVAA